MTRRILMLLAALLLALPAADAQPSFTQDAMAAKIIADARKIGSPQGIERLEKVRIGGIDQDSGHMPMTEEPGKFLVSLLRYARPIAERAGDVAPER